MTSFDQTFQIISFMTFAELRIGQLQNNWGEARKENVGEFLTDYRSHLF